MEKARRSRSLLHSSTKASFHYFFFCIVVVYSQIMSFQTFELCAVNDARVVAMSKYTCRCHSALLRQKKRKFKEKEKFSSLSLRTILT